MDPRTTTAPFPLSDGDKAQNTNDPFWLGHLLLKNNSITVEQLNSAKTKYREKPTVGFASVLEELNMSTPRLTAHMIAAAHRLTVAELTIFTVDREVARTLPETKSKARCIIPFRRADNALHIAVPDPAFYTSAHARQDFGTATQFRFFVAPQKDILTAITDAWKPDEIARDPRMIFENLLKIAVNKKCSDLHLEPMEKALGVRLRVDNRLVHEQFLPAEMRDPVTQAAKLFGRMDISEKRLPQDGMGRLVIGARTYSFRLSCVPCMNGESIVVRVIDEGAGVRTFEELGLFPDQILTLRGLINQPNGVIYVTGPTGSGKTTMLYSCLNQLPASDLKIITLEDPVEVTFPQFTQVPIDEKVGRRFDNTLPFLLRQDPDVMLVGETRDLDTAKVTIRAALTGHLCFSTLHTNDAVGTITRLGDLGIAPFLLAAAVRGVVAQRLLKRVCPNCRRPHKLNAQLIERFGKLLDSANLRDGAQFYEAGQCPACQNRGYNGRIAICEVIPLEGLEEDIARKASEAELRQLIKAKGVRDLREDGILKAAKGLTTFDELVNALGADPNDIFAAA